ncbi:hypothetical protein Z517_11268 [Fonsecaea pedrosoi CBS 271.37]|uniref:Uncharacterized protein n=1 Tax=Fonsecaea pedrosoi CBS 271.37 TaxID=1442368 RepID=A0A0D2EQH2_9EURO|nr:uncharacterized protein Z517_11268 [Fonsecaea pedrosoi CBS 271.37]KIW76522.1 hypothetical protein Z517_11268 [Fonsecaea pedrosoi CBS 271.37]
MPRAPLRRRQLYRNGPNLRGAKQINNSTAKLELEKKLAHKPIGPRPTDSDDSDRLVVKGNGRRGRNVPRQEIYASGAVAAGDKPGNYPTRAQRRKNMTKTTKEIIGTDQRETPKRAGSVPVSKELHQPVSGPPTMNGISQNTTTTNQVPPTAISPATKPPGSVLRATLPTSNREDSILGTLKPRRRQPSILQDLDQDSSSFDLGDGDDFLPDDESTPFGASKLSTKPTTPTSASPVLLSSSRKRKFGHPDPLEPAVIESAQRPATPPLGVMHTLEATPEPSLPAVPLSVLRESGRKQRENVRDEDDIMALPQSSSSPAPSPARKVPSASRKRTKNPATLAPVMTTAELQTHMMPTKKRRTQRERKQRREQFDIPADIEPSDSDASEEDVSNFLPSKTSYKARRKGPSTRIGLTQTKAKSGKARKQDNTATSSKSRSKSSTNLFITTTSPILRPSTSNRETKSPSQHSTDKSSSINAESQVGHSKQYGGSLRKGRGTTHTQDKENHYSHSDNEPSHVRGDDTNTPGEMEEVPTDAGWEGQSNPRPVGKSKWAEIDAWDMDFEDVEVTTGSASSSPTRW